MPDNSPLTISLRLCTVSVKQQLSELQSFIEELAKTDAESVDHFFGLIQSFQSIFDLHSKTEFSSGANTVVVSLELTDRCKAFMAACRAGNLDWRIFDL
jgi:hypothetical protein